MEAELAALAASGATTLVGLMVSESWSQARERVVRFFGRGGADGTADEELRLSEEELVAARASEDELAMADIEAEWRMRLRRALQADPGAAEELRSLLAELAPGAGSGTSVTVNNSVNGVVRNGPVIQGQQISHLTFHSSRSVPPGQSAG
ncbi:hypothetical protein AB0M39_37980 [Streptomyces sp. NPDC051907]|uniref:hypothetical protein n=1 Tax=Streptomyces sp. NPDC051907 TaxID=3155284 RepID=UPI00343491A3